MFGTFSSDARHFLNEEGEITDVTRSASMTAAFLRSIVGWVTLTQTLVAQRTNVTCRKLAGRMRCRGEIEAYLLPEEGEIWYICSECGDNGVIRGWEKTSWDRSSQGVPSKPVAGPKPVVMPAAIRPDPPDKQNPLGPLEKEILEYFRRNPRASDTVEGIAQFWLKGDLESRSEEAVQQALDNLERNGLVAVRVFQGRKRYRMSVSWKN